MEKKSKTSRGRPPSFDRETALDAAVQVFWKQGYDGASISMLTAAMGINPPSLYAAFKNKQGLFGEAIDRYVETVTSTQVAPLMQDTDLKTSIEGYLRQVVRCAASEKWPKGCLVVSVAIEACERDEALRQKVTKLASDAEDFIAQRVEQDCNSNADLHIDDPRSFAQMAVAAGQSLATRARSGASATDLNHLVDTYMQRLF